jgi:hypothetical protein
MVSVYTADDEDEYDTFWGGPTGFPDPNEQTSTQHFPANVSTSEADPTFAYAVPPNVTYHRGTYEPSTSMSDQDLLEALQAQTAQLSLLMNQLPAQLRTPVPTPFAPPTSSIPDHTTSGQGFLSFPVYTTPDPPDLLNDATLLPSTSMHTSQGGPTAYAPVSPLRAPPRQDPRIFIRTTSTASQHSGSSLTHVTTPDGGNRIHLAEHSAMDRIAYSRAELPRTLPVRVQFLRRFRHARTPGARGQIYRWHIRINESSPGTFVQWQIALVPGDYIFEDFGNALTIIAQRSGEEAILLSFPVANSVAWLHQGVSLNGVQRPLQITDHLDPCYLPCFVSRGPRVGGFLHPSC